MTNTETPQGDTPLWDDERVVFRGLNTPTNRAADYVIATLKQMRNDYEAARAADRQRIAALEAELATLRAQVDGGEWEDVPFGERYNGRTGEWIRYDKGQLSQLITPNEPPVEILFPYEWKIVRRVSEKG